MTNVRSRDYEQTPISWQNLSYTLDSNFPNVSWWEQFTMADPNRALELHKTCSLCSSICCLSESFMILQVMCHDHTILNCQKFDPLGLNNNKLIRYGLKWVWLMLEGVQPPLLPPVRAWRLNNSITFISQWSTKDSNNKIWVQVGRLHNSDITFISQWKNLPHPQ